MCVDPLPFLKVSDVIFGPDLVSPFGGVNEVFSCLTLVLGQLSQEVGPLLGLCLFRCHGPNQRRIPRVLQQLVYPSVFVDLLDQGHCRLDRVLDTAFGSHDSTQSVAV